ncbi:MAG: hypothetical protein H6739_23395 [Alphaproteobacteria bacterium]|nr:hypothetical protein [Alphaproteobacteria bacterium]
MNTTTRLALIPILIFPALVGCESIESQDILTSGIYADLTVITDGDGARAQAILRSGGATSNTFVQLTGDDDLSVSADGGEAVAMSEQNLGDIYSYTADLDEDAAGTEFTFAFTRTIDDGAPASTAVLPEPFNATGPAEDSTASRTADDITITWEPSGSADDMELKVHGDCFIDLSVPIEGDPGTYVVEAGTIESPDGTADQACDATITIMRKRSGSLDAGFGEGGVIYAAQSREIKIRMDP